MDNPILYRDFIKPDTSVTDLIEQLKEVLAVYTDMAGKIKDEATTLQNSFKKLNSTTNESREATGRNAKATDELAKAQDRLEQASKDTAKELARLKLEQQKQNNVNKLTAKLNAAAEGSYNRLSAQYSLNKIRLNDMSKAQRESTTEGRKLEKQTRAIYEEMNRLQKATGKSQLQVGQYNRALGGLKTGALQVASALGFTGVIFGLVGAFRNAFNTIKQFDEEMVNMAAIAGKTRDQIGEVEAKIREVAKSSINTAVAVAQTASALYTLGKTDEEILNLLAPVDKLSIALKATSESAGELLVKTLNAFGESSKEAQRFADVIAKMRTSSSLNFEAIEVSLGYIAPTAKAVNLNIEQTGSLLAVLVDNGIRAQRAGRLLSSSFGRLAERGLSLDDALVQINSSQDKTVAAMDLFGAEAFSLGLILADNIETTKEYTAQFENAKGTLNELAENQLQSISAMSKIAKSAWDEFILSVDKGDGTISRLVKGSLAALTELLGHLTRTDADIASNFITEYGVHSIERFNSLMEEAADHLDEDAKRVAALARQYVIADEALTIYNQAQAQGFKTVEDFKKVQDEFINKYGEEKDNIDILNAVYDEYIARIELEEERKKAAEEEAQKRAEAEKARQLQLQKQRTAAAEKQKKIDEQRRKQEEKEQAAREKADKEALAEKIRSQRAFISSANDRVDQVYRLELSEIDLMQKTEAEKTRLRLEAEKKRLRAIININEKFGGELSDLQIKEMQNVIKKIDQEIAAVGSGKDKDLYAMLGINLEDDQKGAIQESTQFVIDNIRSILDMQLQAAEARLAKASEEAENAQTRYDEELQRRADGLSNQAETAQRELEIAHKREQQALKDKQKAQKAQERIDTLMQVTGLITSSVQIWKALSGIPIVGPALAAVAVGAMFASYAAAKIKAKSLAKEQLGEGGFEFLEGGSHASGNDIPIGTTKSGKQRTAEGGETLAVFKKASTRKYRNIIPTIVNSINKGNFEQEFNRSFIQDMPAIVSAGYDSPDLQIVENELTTIRKQGERKTWTDSQGRTVVQYRNVRRTYV